VLATILGVVRMRVPREASERSLDEAKRNPGTTRK
jgi:hypothetical protein